MNLLQLLKNSINTLYVRYIGNDEEGNFPIYYIGGSQTLPPPLTSEEETEILEMNYPEQLDHLSSCKSPHEMFGSILKSYYAKKMGIDPEKMYVVSVMPCIAKKFENTGVGLEDLISIGTIGLMKAINTFNTDKKIKLATYASRCIENEILMHLRRNNRIKNKRIM